MKYVILNSLEKSRINLRKMKLLNTHPVKKSDLGFHGNLFGGKLLAWLDASALGYVTEICRTPRMVTLAIDKLLFKSPVKEGQLIKIYGKVNTVGNTSINLKLEARSHDVHDKTQSLILSTEITFVKINENGKATKITQASY